MKVLMITGDKKFATSERFALQAAQVEKLEVLYWGRDALMPRIPKGHFDVVTAQDPFWRGHLAWHIAWLKGAALNIQVHTDLDALSWWKRMSAHLQLHHADTIRAVTEKIKKQVERMGLHAPVHVLPIFLDLAKFRALQRKPHDTKTILWVGRFEEEKDPALALRVLAHVRAAGVDAKLVMLGSGSLEARLRGLAQGLPVEFVGWQPPAAYLELADVVLCTSRHESWGASMIEALAAGVPVVAPDVGIAREAGAVIAERTQLAQAVERVLRSDTKGELKLELLNANEWAKKWKESLL